MYIRVGWIKENTSYKFTDRGELNNPRYHSNDNVESYSINAQKGCQGFQKRDSKYTKLEYYESHLKKDYCEECGCRDKRLEIHHVNGDHSDVVRKYSGVPVVTVEYLCDTAVYDVEMEHPYHTFLTGKGVVTCNSHATAYGLTAYVGAWLKTYYPTAFYTVVLRDQDEDKMAVLMNEIKSVGGTELEKPNINISGENFTADSRTTALFESSQVHCSGTKFIWRVL